MKQIDQDLVNIGGGSTPDGPTFNDGKQGCLLHFKDNYTDDNNDSLQFKVAITLSETPTYSTYWAYTLTNITADHTIVVTEAVTNKIYARINGTYVEGKTVYKKISGTWTLQSDLTNVFESGVNYKVVT